MRLAEACQNKASSKGSHIYIKNCFQMSYNIHNPSSYVNNFLERPGGKSHLFERHRSLCRIKFPLCSRAESKDNIRTIDC